MRPVLLLLLLVRFGFLLLGTNNNARNEKRGGGGQSLQTRTTQASLRPPLLVSYFVRSARFCFESLATATTKCVYRCDTSVGRCDEFLPPGLRTLGQSTHPTISDVADLGSVGHSARKHSLSVIPIDVFIARSRHATLVRVANHYYGEIFVYSERGWVENGGMWAHFVSSVVLIDHRFT
jgi:hypothetical protein